MKDKKAVITAILSLLVVIALIVAIPYFFFNEQDPSTGDQPQTGQNGQEPQQPVQDERINVSQPRPNDTIDMPLVVRGEARGTWYFEASFPVEVRSASGELLAIKPAQAQGEWMTEDFVPFEVTFEHLNWGDAKEGELILRRDNPSGLPEHDAHITIPIRFPAYETMAVNVYFTNIYEDPEMLDCGAVDASSRGIKKTQATAQAALQELLEGPTEAELSMGLRTNIPEGTKLIRVTIDKGEARALFSPELDRGIGGSCLVTAIRGQIEETLMQFDTVTSVVISVEGKDDAEVLQP